MGPCSLSARPGCSISCLRAQLSFLSAGWPAASARQREGTGWSSGTGSRGGVECVSGHQSPDIARLSVFWCRVGNAQPRAKPAAGTPPFSPSPLLGPGAHREPSASLPLSRGEASLWACYLRESSGLELGGGEGSGHGPRRSGQHAEGPGPGSPRSTAETGGELRGGLSKGQVGSPGVPSLRFTEQMEGTQENGFWPAAGHTTGTRSMSATADAENHVISELECQTGCVLRCLPSHHTHRPSPSLLLTASAVGAAPPPSCLLGTGGGLLRGGPGGRPRGNLVLSAAAPSSGAPLVSGRHSEVCPLLGQLV